MASGSVEVTIRCIDIPEVQDALSEAVDRELAAEARLAAMVEAARPVLEYVHNRACVERLREAVREYDAER